MSAEAKKKLLSKMVGSVDNTMEDVVKWDNEGRTLFFEDDEDKFLTLPTDVVRDLSRSNRQRYDLAKRIARGDSVLDSMTTAIQGFDSGDYAVRPGSASANLAVLGKKPGMDYYWERKENVNKRRSEGWQVDTDSDVKTIHDESCTYKTVGGEKNPEMILVSRPNSISAQAKAKKQAHRDALVGKAQNSYRDAVERVGAEVIVD